MSEGLRLSFAHEPVLPFDPEDALGSYRVWDFGKGRGGLGSVGSSTLLKTLEGKGLGRFGILGYTPL